MALGSSLTSPNKSLVLASWPSLLLPLLFVLSQQQDIDSKDSPIGVNEQQNIEPRDVSNFTCICDNWESLNCTWDVPYNQSNVSYTMSYVNPPYTSVESVDIRTWSNGQRAGIFLNEVKEPIFDSTWYENYDFSLSSQNSMETHTQEFNVDINEIVRLVPPKEFQTTVTGPYNVTIEWTWPWCPKLNFTVRYEISTRISSSQTDYDHPNKDKWTKQNPKNFTIETDDEGDPVPHSAQLAFEYAYTKYDIRLRLHTGTGTIREHMWSDYITKTIRTLSTKPTVAPETIQGMFEVNVASDKRDIFVFWQKIDPWLEYGDGIMYIVEAYDETGKIDIDKNTTYSYVKFENLTLHNSYRFVIKSSNENGAANKHSEVLVPHQTAVQKNAISFNRKVQKAKTEGTIHTISWDFEDSPVVQSITIFWCKKSTYDDRCKNKMEWQTINQTEVLIKEINLILENGKEYAFGRAVTSNNESSGIKWFRDDPVLNFILWWQMVFVIIAVIGGIAALGWIGYQLYRQAKIFCEQWRRDFTEKIPLANSTNQARGISTNVHNINQNVSSKPTPIIKADFIDHSYKEMGLDKNLLDCSPSHENSLHFSTGTESDSFFESHRITPGLETPNTQQDWNIDVHHKAPQALHYVQIKPDKFDIIPLDISPENSPLSQSTCNMAQPVAYVQLSEDIQVMTRPPSLPNIPNKIGSCFRMSGGPEVEDHESKSPSLPMFESSAAYVLVGEAVAWAQKLPPPPTEEGNDNRKYSSPPKEKTHSDPATIMLHPFLPMNTYSGYVSVGEAVA